MPNDSKDDSDTPTSKNTTTAASQEGSRPEERTRRFNMNLSERVFRELEELADRSGKPMSEVVRTALSLYAVASDEVEKKNVVVIADHEGRLIKQLVLPK